VTGSVTAFSTQIVFDGTRVPVEQLAISASAGHFATPRFGWTVTAGGIVAGRIEDRDVAGGATASAGLDWLALYEGVRRPFLAVNASLGASGVRALADDGHRRSWWAFDLRAGVMVGKTFAGRWVPYAAARVFGGPVFWHLAGAGVVGGDRYHVTLGAGLVVRLPAALDLAAEVMPLGEQSVAVALTVHR